MKSIYLIFAIISCFNMTTFSSAMDRYLDTLTKKWLPLSRSIGGKVVTLLSQPDRFKEMNQAILAANAANTNDGLLTQQAADAAKNALAAAARAKTAADAGDVVACKAALDAAQNAANLANVAADQTSASKAYINSHAAFNKAFAEVFTEVRTTLSNNDQRNNDLIRYLELQSQDKAYGSTAGKIDRDLLDTYHKTPAIISARNAQSAAYNANRAYSSLLHASSATTTSEPK